MEARSTCGRFTTLVVATALPCRHPTRRRRHRRRHRRRRGHRSLPPSLSPVACSAVVARWVAVRLAGPTRWAIRLPTRSSPSVRPRMGCTRLTAAALASTRGCASMTCRMCRWRPATTAGPVAYERFSTHLSRLGHAILSSSKASGATKGRTRCRCNAPTIHRPLRHPHHLRLIVRRHLRWRAITQVGSLSARWCNHSPGMRPRRACLLASITSVV